MTTMFPVTITTVEELRLFEQANQEALSRRGAFSLESSRIMAHGAVVSLEEGKKASISRALGLISIAISLLGIGMVMRRRILR